MHSEKGDEICVNVNPEKPDVILQEPTNSTRKITFTYDKVYDETSTQQSIYTDAVEPIVGQVVKGLSCAIFAYGQTGAGKTHTMRGVPGGSAEDAGLIQRSIFDIFNQMKTQDYSDIKMSCSFLEIYNEELLDLFADDVKTKNSKLMLVDHKTRGSVCHGLNEININTPDDALKLIAEAEKKTHFAETKMNKMSNRAHRIFTVICSFKRYETDVTSTLTFIDLAGSEDISKSGAIGLSAREAQLINKSLLTLGRVINALACNAKHIPYRDSKLTRLLSEALGGIFFFRKGFYNFISSSHH